MSQYLYQHFVFRVACAALAPTSALVAPYACICQSQIHCASHTRALCLSERRVCVPSLAPGSAWPSQRCLSSLVRHSSCALCVFPIGQDSILHYTKIRASSLCCMHSITHALMSNHTRVKFWKSRSEECPGIHKTIPGCTCNTIPHSPH